MDRKKAKELTDQLTPLLEAFFTKRGYLISSVGGGYGDNHLDIKFKVLEATASNSDMEVDSLQIGQVAYATLRGKPCKIVITGYPRGSRGRYTAKDIDTGIGWRVTKNSIRMTAREVGYDDADKSSMKPLEIVHKGYASVGTIIYCEGETKVICAKITEVDSFNKTYEVIDSDGLYYDVAFEDCYLKAKDVPM